MSCPPKAHLLAASVTFRELPACGSWRLAACPGKTAGINKTGPGAGQGAKPVSSPTETASGSLHKLV